MKNVIDVLLLFTEKKRVYTYMSLLNRLKAMSENVSDNILNALKRKDEMSYLNKSRDISKKIEIEIEGDGFSPTILKQHTSKLKDIIPNIQKIIVNYDELVSSFDKVSRFLNTGVLIGLQEEFLNELYTVHNQLVAVIESARENKKNTIGDKERKK